jgi:hypothetical protein
MRYVVISERAGVYTCWVIYMDTPRAASDFAQHFERKYGSATFINVILSAHAAVIGWPCGECEVLYVLA